MMKPSHVLLLVMFAGPLWVPPSLFAEYIVTPESIVMGVGGKVQIENLGTAPFLGTTTVTMDGVIFTADLISSKIIEIDIPPRLHWYGPKRLTINNGGTSIPVDGQFQIAELKPFGSREILFDFEEGNPNEIGVYHTLKTTPATVENESGHGSLYSLKETIISGNDGSTRWWITRGSTAFPGRGVYIPEATGMNRLVYDVKAPTGFAGELNIGTYFSDPDLFPDGNYTNPESHNWHFYVMHYLTNPNNTWKTHQDPLFFYSQRQSGGCCADVSMMGEGSTEPIGHRRGEITEAASVVWSRGGKTFTNGSFDVLTRLYVDHSDSQNTGYDGSPIWFDNIGFSSVDDFIERTPSWAIRDAEISRSIEFPFSLTNRKSESRSFYVISEFVSSESRYSGYFSSPEGVYEDSNKNGILESGEPRLNGVPKNILKLDRPFNAGETRHFILKMNSSGSLGNFKTGLVHFVEADVPDSESVYAISTRYSNLTSINKKADGAYRTFTFHVNTPASLPENAISTPLNVSLNKVGNDTWIVWDEVVETVNGTVAWYEIQKGSTPSALEHYRIVSAASPGYIDLGENSPTIYRVRAVSTQGKYSSWAAIISSPENVQAEVKK